MSKLLALQFFVEEVQTAGRCAGLSHRVKTICVQAPCGLAFDQKVMELSPAPVRCAPDDSPDLNELKAVAARLDQSDLSATWFLKRRIRCSYRRLRRWALAPWSP